MERKGLMGIKGIAKHRLDQTAIRALLRKNEAENWQTKLREVIKGQRDLEALFCFLQDLFDACVEGRHSSFIHRRFYLVKLSLIRKRRAYG